MHQDFSHLGADITACRLRPAAQAGDEATEWFNLFALHQNRVPHQLSSMRDNMRESYLPHFLDFVVWGHEHECLADPWVRACC